MPEILLHHIKQQRCSFLTIHVGSTESSDKLEESMLQASRLERLNSSRPIAEMHLLVSMEKSLELECDWTLVLSTSWISYSVIVSTWMKCDTKDVEVDNLMKLVML